MNKNDGVKRFNAGKYNFLKDVTKSSWSDIKRYEEIRKLTTGQGENYTSGFLLDNEYVKSHYRLIAVDLSR